MGLLLKMQIIRPEYPPSGEGLLCSVISESGGEEWTYTLPWKKDPDD